MSKHVIELVNLSKEFDGEQVLNSVNLYIRDGEFLTLLGPSGCGKTTMLRLIAGFENPSSGQILLDGRDISSIPAYQRRVNTVFQRYALFPHMNVHDNIAFGLNVKKKKKAFIEEKVEEMLALVDMRGLGRRRVNQLSGGQQQRVAIARALANEPEILLLDEPLGALDLKLRKEMQIELKQMQQQLGITFIFVTHDQEEALSMSDTIVVMRSGSIQQIGTPIDIYNEPKNAFVADFIGNSNLVSGTMQKDRLVSFLGLDFPCLDSGFANGAAVDVVIRPEDIELLPAGATELTGEVESVVFMGVHYEMFVNAGGHHFQVQSTRMAEHGSQVSLGIGPDAIHVMEKLDVPLEEDNDEHALTEEERRALEEADRELLEQEIIEDHIPGVQSEVRP